MADDLAGALKTILFRKAQNLYKGNKPQGSTLIQELGIDDLNDAFIVGCWDAMIYDAASAMGWQVFGGAGKRKEMIKEFWSKLQRDNT